VFDYMALVDANMGVNKANLKVDRSISTKLFVDDSGDLNQHLKIGYKNNSDTENKTLGDYHNYLRVYMPQAYKINEVKINDLPLLLASEIKAASDSTALVRQTEKGQVLDLFLSVPKTSERTISISMVRPQPFSHIKSYFFTFVKQPGYKEEAIELEFNPGNSYNAASTELSGQVAGATTLDTSGVFKYNTNLIKDETVKLDLVSK
jgi:hypothetical protein